MLIYLEEVFPRYLSLYDVYYKF